METLRELRRAHEHGKAMQSLYCPAKRLAEMVSVPKLMSYTRSATGTVSPMSAQQNLAQAS